MLQELHLQNFQSHNNTTISFDPGLNAITGSTDSGKSAIMRALKWLIYNRPKGDAFKTDTATKKDTLSVRAVFDDADITRFKKGTKNAYKIKGIKESLKALRTDVPDEVKDRLRLIDVNMQEQLRNAYFLLDDKPSAVAAKFNEVAGLKALDLCVGEIKKSVNTLNVHTKTNELELSKVQAAIARLDWVEEADTELKELEHIQNNLEQTEAHITQLSKLYGTAKLTHTKLQALTQVDACMTLLEDLDSTHNEYTALNDEIHTLSNLTRHFKTIRKQNAYVRKVVKQLPDVNVLQTDADTIQEISQSINTLQQRVESYKTLRRSVRDTAIKVSKANDEVTDALKTHTNCPLCGSTYRKLK